MQERKTSDVISRLTNIARFCVDEEKYIRPVVSHCQMSLRRGSRAIRQPTKSFNCRFRSSLSASNSKFWLGCSIKSVLEPDYLSRHKMIKQTSYRFLISLVRPRLPTDSSEISLPCRSSIRGSSVSDPGSSVF
jgi:hypothetical protein